MPSFGLRNDNIKPKSKVESAKDFNEVLSTPRKSRWFRSAAFSAENDYSSSVHGALSTPNGGDKSTLSASSHGRRSAKEDLKNEIKRLNVTLQKYQKQNLHYQQENHVLHQQHHSLHQDFLKLSQEHQDALHMLEGMKIKLEQNEAKLEKARWKLEEKDSRKQRDGVRRKRLGYTSQFLAQRRNSCSSSESHDVKGQHDL